MAKIDHEFERRYHSYVEQLVPIVMGDFMVDPSAWTNGSSAIQSIRDWAYDLAREPVEPEEEQGE